MALLWGRHLYELWDKENKGKTPRRSALNTPLIVFRKKSVHRYSRGAEKWSLITHRATKHASFLGPTWWEERADFCLGFPEAQHPSRDHSCDWVAVWPEVLGKQPFGPPWASMSRKSYRPGRHTVFKGSEIFKHTRTRGNYDDNR